MSFNKLKHLYELALWLNEKDPETTHIRYDDEVKTRMLRKKVVKNKSFLLFLLFSNLVFFSYFVLRKVP